MTDRLVSVVVCTYNGSLFIEEQLVSILNQTYTSLEVIIVDDASTDATYELLKPFTADKRVQLFRNDKNVGYNLNFSWACEKATGDYIAIADQDDIWELNKIETLVKAVEAEPTTVLAHGVSARFEKKEKPHLRSLKFMHRYKGNDIRSFYLKNPISGHNILFRQELLKKALPFPEKVYYDWWLVANACAIGKITGVDKVLVWHRMHSTNATGAAKQRMPFFKQEQTILNALVKIKGLNNDHKAFGEKLLQYYKELQHKPFSFSLFWFLLRHAKVLFAYKKRTFPWISYSKHAFRYSARNTFV
jgi:glycosyltransferase involved in cell wall biosynthesis